MRKRLKDREAEMLGFEITTSVKGNPRYSMTDKEWKSVQAFRNIKQTDFKTTKKTFDKNGALVGRVEKRQSKELIDIPENHQVKRVSTNVSTGQQWVITEPKKDVLSHSIDELKEIHTKFIEDAKEYAFDYPIFKREKIEDAHCLVFDAADIHIGKICSSFETGETYNSQIAVQRVRSGLNGILNKSNGWNIDKVIFIAGNDILHVDNAHSTTTSGTGQDTDQMWYDNYNMAKKLLVEIIEKLLTIADVEVVYNPSNHDFTHGFMLLDSVSSWFHNCKQVTFDNDMSHRKYTVYGNNLIGSTHMDGAKIDKLHGLMAEEASEHWHKCKHRYIYGHHVHHKTSKDVFSVCIETLRSPSGSDSWHHRKGFQHSPQAVEGFIHHPIHGQVGKLVHIF